MSTQPMEKLRGLSQDLLKNLGDRALDSANDALDGLSDRLSGIADGGGVAGKAMAKAGEEGTSGGNPVIGGLKGAASGIKDKVTGGGGGGSDNGEATKSTNIIESIDVGVPLSVAYNQWTEFGEFPSFMKKVERAEAEEENKVTFKAQIFLSHRTWESTILEQVPDKRIVWRSSGEKGHVDGAVTFHELAPELTRILVVLEYYPQGFFEKTGNLWRAQGRRARAELRHFRRHVMTRTILEPEEIEGWRGVIEDGEVVEDHDEHVQREEEESEESEDQYDEAEGDEDEEPEDEYDEPEDDEAEPEDEYDEPEDEEPEDEYDEPEDEDEDVEPEDDEAQDEYDEAEEEPEEPEDEYDEPEDEEPEDEDVEERPRRRRRSR